MKKETTPKSKKWILPVSIAAAVLVIVGVVLAIFLGPWQGKDPNSAQSKLYWNIDRQMYLDPESNISIREPGADGLFAIRFAVDGQQVELKCADKRLVNNIDFMDLMGLTFDADGLIIEVLDPATVATEIAKEYFVQTFDGTALRLNSSMAMNGMELPVQITENTKIYNVTSGASVVGEPTTDLQTMDMVSVYGNEAGEVTHVFLVNRTAEAGIYYRLDRFYDRSTGYTSREPDENGIYTITFAHKGQLVDLKCKDRDLVSFIDRGYDDGAIMGLTFDEEGYINNKLSVVEAMRGKKLFMNYTVTDIQGSTVTFESKYYTNTDLGQVGVANIPADCEIYLIENGCEAEFKGQAVDALQLNDRCYVFADVENNPKMIFINRRVIDSPLYYNAVLKYDKTRQETTREPDANGYYVFLMSVDGKQVTLRTKSKEHANKIDSASNRLVTLKLNGTTIEAVGFDSCSIHASGSNVTGRWAMEMMGPVVRFVNRTDFTTGSNHVLAANFAAYDVTDSYGNTIGSKTELRKYDLCNYYCNEAGELVYTYVTQRYVEDGILCYNYERKYNATTEETSRVPDEEGYYVFKMAGEGKDAVYKTKDKALATWIDAQGRKVVTLKVSNGIIKDAFSAVSAVPAGIMTMTGGKVDKVNPNGTISLTSAAGEYETSSYTIAKDCKIYNVCTVVDHHRGEKTTLKKGDVIFPLVSRETKEIKIILVYSGRRSDSPLYWKTDRHYNFTTQETSRVPDADGWYVYTMAVEGQLKTLKTKDKALATAIDKTSAAVALQLDGDVIQQVYSYTYAKDGVESIVCGGFVLTQMNGSTMTLEDLDPSSSTNGKTVKADIAKNCKIFDVSSYAEKFGAAAKLEVGDRVTCYANKEGEVVYCYITRKDTRAGEPVSYCEHCDKDVYWVPFTGEIYRLDAHYYLPVDLSTNQLQVGFNATQMQSDPKRQQYEMVLDLNGHTLTGSVRAFLVYGTLSVMDSVGGGVIQGGTHCALNVSAGATLNLYGGTLKAAENVEPINYGGTISCTRCTVNIYGGTVAGGVASTIEKDGKPSKGRGGSIYAFLTDLNIYGGTIEAGEVEGSGGTVYALDTNFNMTGGTILGGTATDSGGAVYLHKSSTGSTMNMSGGTIKGGVDGGIGDTVYISGSAFNMTGGTIDGECYINTTSTITLSGKPVISGQLLLPPEGKLTLGELTDGASVDVYAEGVFTEGNENAESYIGYFHTAAPLDVISLTEDKKALTYTRYTPSGDTFDNNDLVFDEGTENAVCPACGEKVTWIGLDQQTYAETAYGTLANGAHVYLKENITYSGTSIFITAPGELQSACLHLNGKDLTASNANAILGSAGVLNVMGTGTVTGYSSAGTRAAAVAINTTGADGVVNLYGGTYAQVSGSTGYTVGINDNGGKINLYKQVTVNGSKGVRVGTANRTNAVLGIYGATVNGRLAIAGASGEFASEVTIDSAKINARLDYGGASTVTLSGATVITGGLNFQADGVQVTLGELTEGAAIAVYPTEHVFTVINQKAPDYKDFFYPVNSLDTIELTDDNLALRYVVYVPEELPDEMKVCPTCGEIPASEWIPVTSAPSGEGFTTGHYYLETNISNKSRKTAWTITGKVCIDLNGHDITSTYSSANDGATFKCNEGGELTIMGSGTVTCNKTSTTQDGGTGAVVAYKGTVHLYGGTYVSGRGNSYNALQATAGGIMNVYEGVSVTTGAIAQRGTAVVNVYGGSFAKINSVQTPANVIITGGTFAEDPSAYVDQEAYDVTESEGVYTVAQKVASEG